MSARVIAFPAPSSAMLPVTAAAVAAWGAQPVRARRKYSLTDMIRLCGLDQYERRTAIEHLRLYARSNGLPLPRNARVHGRQVITGPEAIGARSQWDALLVDAWLDDPRPPCGGAAASASAASAPPVPAPRRAAMAERARQLAAAR